MGVVVALGARDLLRIRSDVAAARDDLRSLDLAAGTDLTGVADRARARIEAADRTAQGSPWLGVLGALPGLDRQVDELRDLTATVGGLAPVMTQVAAEVDAALEGAQTGAGRIRLLEVIGEQLDVVEDALVDVPRAEDPAAGPIGGARRELDDEIAERIDELAVAERRVEAISRLLVGPSTLLVLGGNNAEMSGAVGMPLTASVLHIAGGEFELDDFIPTNFLVPPNGLPPPGDLGHLFPLHGVGYDFRGTTGTANFPSVGPLLVAMSANTTTGPVDGVVLLDSFSVAALVGAVGSVEIDGQVLDGEAVFDDLVIGNYQRFGQPGDRPERYALQALYAEAIFDEVTAGNASPARLADALADSAATRHLLAWSPDPDLQELYEATGADGAVDADAIVVAVENMDGNKLDTFIQPTVTVESLPQLDGGHLVTLSVDVAFPVLPTEALIPYVLGPTPQDHFVQTVFHVPDVAGPIEVLEAPERSFERTGRDGRSDILTALYGIHEGESERFTVRFRLPPGIDALQVVPSARPLGQRYLFDGFDVVDYQPFAIPLDPLPDDGTSTAELVVTALATMAAVAVAIAAERTRRRLGRAATQG